MTRPISMAHLSLISTPPIDLIRIAAECGYAGTGFRLTPTSFGVDHQILGNERAIADLEKAVQDSGISVVELEVVRLKEDGPMLDPRPLLEVGARLGARYAVTTMEDPDPIRRVDTLANFASLAGSYGMGVTLEFMIFSACPTLVETQKLVEQVGAPNIVILIDPLHLERGGGTASQIASVPERLLPFVQICDAPTPGAFADPMDARAEAIASRMYPGTGALPLVNFVRALPQETWVSVEVPTAESLNTNEPKRIAAELFAATTALLELAEGDA